LVTPATLRAQFPEFTDPVAYTDAAIGLWLSVSVLLLDPNRWDTLIDTGTSLFICHHLTLAARDQQVAAAGGIPGAVQGIMTAKAVDKVSAGYDAQSVLLTDGDFWNMSSYGIQFLNMARLLGAGGVQF
jgi:hypothetical protein